MEHTLGIHLGSTNSSAAFVHPRTREPEILAPFEGTGAVVPSIVDGKPFDKRQDKELAAALLSTLRTMAEQTLECPATRAVITLAYQVDRERLALSARAAGFREVDFVPAPVAAALAYLGDKPSVTTAFVLILGGQDAEAAVVQLQAGRANILRRASQPLGGHRLDQALVSVAPGQDPQALKHELTRREVSKSGLTRTQFEQAAGPVLDELEALCAQLAGTWSEIECLILAGGGAEVPALRRRLQKLAGRAPLKGPRGEEALAIGAALAASHPALLELAPSAPSPEPALAPAPVPSAEQPQSAPGPEPEQPKPAPHPVPEQPQSAPSPEPEQPQPAPHPVPEQPQSAPSPEPEPPAPPPLPKAQPPQTALLPPPSLHWAEKASVLAGVPKGCWRPQPVDPNRQVWLLPQEFTAHYFPDSPYEEVMRDTEPDAPFWSFVLFARRDGRRELFLPSRQANGEYYEIDWMPGEPATHVNRCRDGQPVAPAMLTPLPQPGFHLASPDIDEQLQFFTLPLMRIDAESRRDRFLKILPWIRLLLWFGQLQRLDPPAYGRVPGPFKQVLGQPNFEAALTHLPPETIYGWVEKGLLPPELEPVGPSQAPALLQSIVAQQRMAPPPPAGGSGLWGSITNALSGATGPKIPGVLFHLNPQMLDQLDLMALVTMGALKSVETFFDREARKLLARRPDLQALLKQPDGASRVMQDPELAALRNHPEVQREAVESSWRAMGQSGPNPLEQSKAMERTMAMQLMFGIPFDPGAGLFQKKLPWKIYEPFQG